ncbi:MAG: YcjX family protein [Rhizobiaceae bacterium]
MRVNLQKGTALASPTTLQDELRLSLMTMTERLAGLANPSVRIGVSGLSRAGKTVFISALVHNLLHGGRLAVFEPWRNGRIATSRLEPQPDDAVPRFAYENHIRELLDARTWPQSTRAISQLRLTIEYQSASGWNRMFAPGRLSVDIVDYPGEWLLDLPLLTKSYAEFCAQALELAKLPLRDDLSEKWLGMTHQVDGSAPADEMLAQRLSEEFTHYLRACRADERAMSTLPPGRFLMPGDMEGSPALTFAPLIEPANATRGSLWAMMERRYEAYKSHVVKPFFMDHVAKLDRQIVLIDAMQALNAGPHAIADLERALAEILACFRIGKSSWLPSFFTHSIDKILIAATKADQLHHTSHDRLEALVRRLADRAVERAAFSGAEVDVVALAAVRSTREAHVKQGKDELPVIIGTPLKGETIGDDLFDGKTETAIFPGDLPDKPESIFKRLDSKHDQTSRTDSALRFVRFRPPALESTKDGITLSLPHIRLDRALQFLIGDKLA